MQAWHTQCKTEGNEKESKTEKRNNFHTSYDNLQ